MAGAKLGKAIYRFGPFRLDAGARVLSHRGRRVALRGKVFDLLELLVSREGQVVNKATLVDALWAGIAVHENNIAVTVRALRKALHEHDATTEWIETVAGHGYRLAPGGSSLGAVAIVAAPEEGGPEPQSALGAEHFVAREAELGRLDELWAAARRGAGRVVFVSGEPGIGKSTLLARFMALALARTPLALPMRGQCIQLFGLAEPHLPFREALGDGLSSDARGELLDALERHAPGWCARLSPALVGARAQAGEPWRAHAGALELGDALRAAATSRPILLLLEDLHWADASSVDVLRWLCGRVHGRAIFVLGTYRPADVRAGRHPFGALLDELAGRGERLELALGPWRSRDLERYIAARFESPALGAALAPSIERLSEGLPLLSVRLVESLLDREVVRRDEAGAWALACPLQAIELGAPESVAALIESQLGLLPARSRQLLEVASVDGAEFGTALLSEVLGALPADVESMLQHLADTHGLIEHLGVSDERLTLDVRYRFRHVLYREHLYDHLGSHRRQELHLGVARVLLGSRAEASSPSRLAFHFERGRDASRAVAWWTEAGDAADRAFAKREALECYERAAALLDGLPAGERALRRLVLEHGRGWAEHGLSHSDAARHHFSEFARLARELVAAPAPDRDAALALASEYFGRPWSDVVMRRPAGIFPRAASGDVASELLAESLHCCCHVAHAAGRDDDLYQHARALERVAQASSSGPRRAEALAWLGVHALHAGRAEQARQELDAAVALARQLDHERALRVALASRARLHRMQAEHERARGAYEELWSRVPDASSAAEVLSELGATLAAAGRAGAALDAYRRADGLRQRISPGFPSLHGALLRELGQLEAARELDRTALSYLRGKAERQLLGRLASSLAVTSCRQGDRAAAEELLSEAEALLAAERDDCSWRSGPLWGARCEVAAAAGDGVRLLREARRWLRSARARADAEGMKRAGHWLAVAFARWGDTRRAFEQLRLALDATRAHAVPLVDWRCQALLGQIAERLGDAPAAARARREAQHAVEDIAHSLDDASARSGFEHMAARELGASVTPGCAAPGSQSSEPVAADRHPDAGLGVARLVHAASALDDPARGGVGLVARDQDALDAERARDLEPAL